MMVSLAMGSFNFMSIANFIATRGLSIKFVIFKIKYQLNNLKQLFKIHFDLKFG